MSEMSAKQKRILPTELCYVLGMLVLPLGSAIVERANLGVSMITAPSYLLYLRFSQYFSFFTYGFSSYAFQLLLLIALCILIRRIKLTFLFAFVSAFLFGILLDFYMKFTVVLPQDLLGLRVLYFAVGVAIEIVGVAFMLKTYITQEAYEVFVLEFARCFDKPISKVKWVYDISSMLLAIFFSFLFFGFGVFRGVGIGTIVAALINGPAIGLVHRIMEKHFTTQDCFSWRPFFDR